MSFVLLIGCESTMVPPLQPASSEMPVGAEWRTLLVGTSLEGWEVIRFGGEGEVEVRDGMTVLNLGQPFTGIRWTNGFPKVNYEIELEACRLLGGDFFCGLTVPVGESHCTLIIGGWGGGVMGISSLDGLDASENETTSYRAFENNHWYRIRLRVGEGRIEAWLDDEQIVDVPTLDRRVGLRRGMIEMSRPLGICSWHTTAGIRDVKVRGVE